MATEMDTILGRTSTFFNKRMRQVSSLSPFFVIKFIPCNFSYVTITICRSFKSFFFKFLLTLNLSPYPAMDLLLVEFLKIFYMNQRMERSSRNFFPYSVINSITGKPDHDCLGGR